MNKPIDIIHYEEAIEVYTDDLSNPIIIEKEKLFNWLADNELISWQEDPADDSEVGEVDSGTFTMDEYFEQEKSVIEGDITKYLNGNNK